MADLVKLVGPFQVVTQIDEICRQSGNPSARFAACYITAQDFPGRCDAYRLARSAAGDGFQRDYLIKLEQSCGRKSRTLIDYFRSGAPAPIYFYGSSQTPPGRRETIRVYASAMDPEVRRAACQLAATVPDTRDIPECSAVLIR